MRSRLAASLLAAALAVGCSSSDDEATRATPAPTTADATTTTLGGSGGCSNGTRPLAGESEVRPLPVDGFDRTYRIFVPTGYDPAVPMPLVFNFHGFSSNADQQAAMSALEPLAEAEGFIAVHPQGTAPPAIGVPFWNLDIGNRTGPIRDRTDLDVDDVAFVGALLDALEVELCVDTGRVYAMGMSNGGYFSSLLACRMADRIAAVSAVAAVMHPDDCVPARPVPIQEFHGDADPIVPFLGGPSTLGDIVDLPGETDVASTGIFDTTIPDEVAEWAETNGCDVEPEVSAPAEDVELRDWEGCDAGADVRFYVVADGGHTWPGSPGLVALEDILGRTTLSIDATALSWSFFQQHVIEG